MSKGKTNALRLLDTRKFPYSVYSYDNKDGKIDGKSVAEKIGKDISLVYKTLVAIAASKQLYVFVIPVAAELDLKKAAKAAGEKKLDMLPVKELQKHTGYIRGGCSPVGMKKELLTYIDESILTLETVIVSAGKIGLQMEVKTADFLEITQATVTDIVSIV